MRHMTIRRSASLALAVTALLGPATAATAAGRPQAAPSPAAATAAPDRQVVAGLDRYAHRLRGAQPGGSGADLEAFGKATRGASIVGIGEVSHGSGDVFALKDRLLRHLVTREGFSAFAMEINWSAAARIDAYVRTGEGDLRQIMGDEFQDAYGLDDTEEYLRLFSWVREHNRTSAHQVRIVGVDFSDVNPEQYDRLFAWAGRNTPALVPELRERYAALRALRGGVAERLAAYGALPLAERKKMAEDADAAYRLLEGAAKRDARVLQDARVVSQMAASNAFDGDDPAQALAANRYRDRAMAENAVWWQRNTGDRILLSAHDGHITYETALPHVYPVTMGADLRELVGKEYLAVGTSAYGGAYRARTATGVGTFPFAAAPGSNEYVLDQVRHRDFYVDLREARRDPALTGWLDTARPTFMIPGRYPYQTAWPLALGRGYDIVMHLHEVGASVPLTRP
ncbi:erythromycin esterase family protein [Streptomyces luteoverticillatus]|uniref:Erythromycin esterase family protein n=1 Tax=Streptomyces luteoverticillatus TaxID=66425 RepID=A0A3S9PCC1_STRLT|nr:erythromycin esterase family protein [Streptomyces luteoverticillatus]AZQ70013.1 erythromycin esterase family protein [Streptomyces luteoverticillatus]